MAQAADLLSLQETIDTLGITRSTCYRWLREGRLQGHKAGRQWRFRRGDIDRFLSGDTTPAVADEVLLHFIAKLRSELGEASGDSNDAVEAVRLLVKLALRQGASDMHFELCSSKEAWIRLRVDGVLHVLDRPSAELHQTLLGTVKGLCHCHTTERTLPQDGRMKVHDPDAGDVDLLISTMPASLGEEMTIGIKRQQDGLINLDHIGFLPEHRQQLDAVLQKVNGLTLIVGPTGSGKTTTLYACLGACINQHEKIISIEDQLGYAIPGCTQIPLKPHKGLTYATVLRAALRGDPDTVMLADINDAETAELALIAAMTGHRVLACMHANDCVHALQRLLDFGCAPFLISEAVRLVVAQRLARKICQHCQGHGCDHCHDSGYRGRMAIHQCMMMDDEIHAALLQGQIDATLVADFAQQSRQRVTAGETSDAEWMRVSGSRGGKH